MLSTAQIIPYLLHSQAGVRLLALYYLAEAHDPSPATAEDVWRAIDRFGGGKVNAFYEALPAMPQTETSLTRTLAAFGTADESARKHLEKVVADLSYGLLMRFDDKIGATPALSKPLRDHLKKRIELASLPANELWDQLMDISGQDPISAGRLIEALSRNPESAQFAITTLNDSTIKDARLVWAIQLLGQLRFRSATESLVEKLTLDHDSGALHEASAAALVQIGSVDAVGLVARKFGKMPWSGKLNATHVLRRIKIQQSEAAAMELLSRETDLQIRTSLAHALCELGTTRTESLDALGQMIVNQSWDRHMLDLGLEVDALFAMLGKTRPEAPRQTVPAKSQPFISDIENDEELMQMVQMPIAAPSAAVATKRTPIRRGTTKVGRNDPCTCGSGRKFKKCCGK